MSTRVPHKPVSQTPTLPNSQPDCAEKSSKLILTPPLRASVRDGMANAVALGIGESYLNVFGIFLHASALQLSLLSSIPPFLGAVSQLFGVWLLRFVHSRRAIAVFGVVSQAAMWLVLASLPWLAGAGDDVAIALIILASLFQVFPSIGLPAWNSLMGDMIPADQRGRFFGLRNRMLGICTFVGLIAGGQILDLFRGWDDTVHGFLTIFLIAALARSISAYFMSRYDDPPYHRVRGEYFSLRQFITGLPRSNFAKFTVFLATINAAVAFSGPFFAVYMLRDLHMSYTEFTMVIGVAAIVQFLTMGYWGQLLDSFGAKKIMNVCGVGIALNPFMWLVDSSVPWLMFAQATGSFMWAGFNLASANFLFDAVTPPKRARCAAYQSLVTAVFVLIAATIGGFTATHLPSSLNIFGHLWFPVSPLVLLFAISGVIRMTAVALILPRVKEVRKVQPIKHTELAFRIVSAFPLTGFTFSVITGIWEKRGQGR